MAARRPSREGALTNAQKQRRWRQKQKMKALMEVNGTPADWVPAFPGQRPPFGPGNRAAVRHGASVPEVVDPIAEQLVEWLLSIEGNEYLADARNGFALNNWGHARARVLVIRRYLAGQDLAAAMTEITEVEEEGTTTPAVMRKYTRAKNTVSTMRALQDAERAEMYWSDRLGLSPLARMKLGKVAQSPRADLALIWAAEDEDDTG